MGEFYRMQRGWLNHRVFRSRKQEPFCRAAAWCWLIDQAAHKPVSIERGGKIVELRRGQLSHSFRFVAEAWGWPIGRVQRFVSLLTREAMIDTSSDTGQIVITICNYDKYQGNGFEPIQEPSRQRFSSDSKTKESLSGSKDPSRVNASRSTRARDPAACHKLFEQWWAECRHKVGKRAAERAYIAALARASPAELLEGYRRYVASKPPDRQWLNPATFLNQDRHLDQPALLLPLNGGNRAGRKLSPNEKLLAGFAAAAGFNSGIDGAPPEPLLDARRSA
jgi:hypothetical protein